MIPPIIIIDYRLNSGGIDHASDVTWTSQCHVDNGMTSRRPHDVRGMIYPPESHFVVGCQTVARGLSLKLCGRFYSFSASKLVWLSRHQIYNFVTIRSISEPWESLFITMATVAKVTGPLYFSCHKGPKAHLHA